MSAIQHLGQYLENPEFTVVGMNVDTQIGFMVEGRNLYVEGAEDPELRYNLGNVFGALRENGYTVVHTGDWHEPRDDEIIMPYEDEEPDGVNTFPPHCPADGYAEVMGVEPGGADFIEETAPVNPVYLDWREEDVDGKIRRVAADGGVPLEPVVLKNEFNVFEGSPHMDPLYEELDYDVTITGGVTEGVCVNENVMGHAERGVEVYVLEDGIERLADELADPAREQWEEHDNVHMVKSSEVVELLGGRR